MSSSSIRPTINVRVATAKDKKVHSVGAASFLIGRGGNSAIKLDHSGISRAHLEISYQDGHVYAADLGSANGSFYNGVKMKEFQRVPLSPDDVIVLGKSDIRISAWPDSQTNSAVLAASVASLSKPHNPFLVAEPPFNTAKSKIDPFQGGEPSFTRKAKVEADETLEKAKQTAREVIADAARKEREILAEAKQKEILIIEEARQKESQLLETAQRSAAGIVPEAQRKAAEILLEAQRKSEEIGEKLAAEINAEVELIRARATAEIDEVRARTIADAKKQAQQELDSELRQARLDLANLHEELESLKSTTRQARLDSGIAADEIKDLHRAIAQLTLNRQELDDELENLIQRRDEFLHEIRELEETNHRFETINNEIRSQKTTLQNELSDLRQRVVVERGKLDNSRSELQETNDRLKEVVQKHREEVAALTTRKLEIDTQLAAAKEELDGARQERTAIQESFAEQLKRAKENYEQEAKRYAELTQMQEEVYEELVRKQNAAYEEQVQNHNRSYERMLEEHRESLARTIDAEKKQADETSHAITQSVERLRNEHRQLNQDIDQLETKRIESTESVRQLTSRQAQMQNEVNHLEESLRSIRSSNEQTLKYAKVEADTELQKLKDDSEKRISDYVQSENRRLEALKAQMLRNLHQENDSLSNEIHQKIWSLLMRHVGQEVYQQRAAETLAVIKQIIVNRIMGIADGETSKKSTETLQTLKRRSLQQQLRSASIGFAAAFLLLMGFRFWEKRIESLDFASMADAQRIERERELAARRFNPPQDLNVRDSYVDAVLYTKHFDTLYLEPAVQQRWVKEASDYLFKKWRVDETKTVQVIATAQTLVSTLRKMKGEIHPDFVKQNLAKMKEVETDSIKKMSELLGTRVKYEALKKFEKNFFMLEITRAERTAHSQ